ncbi:MAG: LPS assembly lipoprotein LptE [Rubrivivax sp.]|nr:LPS assembly lipoprotein LptE [Rubrivivax sp.]
MWLSRRVVLVAGAAAAASASAALLSGCGFQLRQPPRVAFSSIALTGFAPRSPLHGELKRQLQQQVQVLDAPDRAQLVLLVLDDVRERSVVASTAAAQVRELQLRLRFHFRVRNAAGRELIPRAELQVSRDLSYSETAALAKEAEEAELYREMQSDIAAQVMRRLATLTVTQTLTHTVRQ